MSNSYDVVYPLPWRVENLNILAADATIIHNGRYGLNLDAMERIVACVNACGGIPTEALKEMKMSGEYGGLHKCWAPDWWK